MRALIGTLAVSIALSSTAWAQSHNCDLMRFSLIRPGPEKPEQCQGKVEDRLDCLSLVIARQNQEIAVLKCELEQLSVARVMPLTDATAGR